MKILLLLSESWNDKTAPNNNMTNWFKDFSDVEIWTISDLVRCRIISVVVIIL